MMILAAAPGLAQKAFATAQGKLTARRASLPPRVTQAQKFLAQRGWSAGRAANRANWRAGVRRSARMSSDGTQAQTAASATWQALGPAAVQTKEFGLVTGRVSALAFDPSDATGNRVYLGSTGGGVWMSQNAAAANPQSVAFTPLTDAVEALSGALDASISIGALTVQPGGTGVILAGTGDPNDLLDSYYGSGILRSTDGGNSWSLIPETDDLQQGLSTQNYSFVGEGIAGFAWSTISPQQVVAAVSQAYEGTLVNLAPPPESYEGLYYSSDGGASWHLATISDGSGYVQGPTKPMVLPDGIAATSVVWNPIRQLFVAALRHHGYYQSPDGITWKRMGSQPGADLSTSRCPANSGIPGSEACPIFRGALAVNPQTGDTFAWTVGAYDPVTGLWANEGIWQDACAINNSGNACTNQTIAFTQLPWFPGTDASEPTIADGGYTLALAAAPVAPGLGEDTVLLAGADDLWKCSLAMGCQWRNATNGRAGFCAHVAPYQHSLAWNTANPLEVFVGNDSGLWRSTDQIGESGVECGLPGNSDAAHFQNLNGGLGSLAEVESMSQAVASPYSMMAGLGANGTAGVKGTSLPAADWPQILGGTGGPVAIGPGTGKDWYVNAESGVSIYLCAQLEECTAADFGTSPVIDMNAEFEDGYGMSTAAPLLVDALDPSQLLIGTCRVWRVPGGGVGWNASEAVSPIFDSGAMGTTCSGDSHIRSMAAMALPDGNEIVYVGTYGWEEGGFSPFGQVWSATIQPGAAAMPNWTNLTLNNVPTNDGFVVNANGLDISSVSIDSHDPSGQTVYVTVEGFPSELEAVPVRLVYRSADGGKSWTNMTANLPFAPASSLVVDPQDENTVYLATDLGVYFTTKIKSCVSAPSACWSVFGTGLPAAPVVALSATAATTPEQVLIAGTYGRGIWQTPLWTAGTSLTTATADPDALIFPSQAFGTDSKVQAVTLKNTGTLALTPTLITMSGDFSETDNCQQATVPAGASCAIQVKFRPTDTGNRTGEMTVSANVYGGQLTIALRGTGTPAGAVTLTPPTIDFGPVKLGTTSSPLPVSASNSGPTAVPITGITITSPFTIANNTCGTTSLATGHSCLVDIEFTPVQRGAVAGTLTFTDGAGVQTVALTGSGVEPPADTMSTVPLAFPATVTGQLAAAQRVLLANTGDQTLTSIAISVTGPFQTSNNCGTQLGGGASCQISVIFAPLTTGAQAGTLTVSDALRTQTVALSGTGVLPAVLSVNPTALNFATQLPGVASSPLSLTINNTGGAPAADVTFQITGVSSGSFATGVTSCEATLNNGGSCTVQVIFDPATTGGSAATLEISYLTPAAKVVNVPLTGTAQVSSGLSVNPAVLTFAAENPGQSSAAQTVTISNSSAYPAATLVVSATPPFKLTGNTCASSLGAKASCSVGVVFAPTTSGPATGALTVSSTSIATQATVVLNGTGAVAAAIQVTPAIINFAAIAETGVGVTSSPATVTVSNIGTIASLTNLALAVPAGFELVNNTCAATLGPGTSCTTGVVFAPVSAGALSGNLVVTSSSAASSAQVALSGMGLDFTVAATGSTTQSVVGGQTANYTLTIKPLNGSQGVFTFECATLPENAICTFNPVTEAVSAGAVGDMTVAVSTGRTGTSAGLRQTRPWRVVPLACALMLLPLALWRRRKFLQMAALLVFMAYGVSSCASSGGGTGGGPGGGKGVGTTPAGTYPIPVTVMCTGVQHSLTVSLTVD